MDRSRHHDPHSLAHAAGVDPDASVSSREEAEVHRVLSEAVPPADISLQAAVIEEISRRQGRRRVVAFLPVAASVLLAVVGALLLGGVPGGGLLAMLPAWTQQGWMTVARAAHDWTIAATATLRAAPQSIPTMLPVVAGLLGLAALGMVVALAVRWRTITPWRRDD